MKRSDLSGLLFCPKSRALNSYSTSGCLDIEKKREGEIEKMRKRKTFKQFVALIMALFIIVSLIPSGAVNAEDIATGTDAEYNDETDDKPSVEISDSSNMEDISVEEETSEKKVRQEEKISREEGADVEEIEVVDSDLSEDDSNEEDSFIVFDHMYSDADTSVVNTTELFVETNEPSVFTKNTTVESNYENIYIISFSSVEEARYAYSYYIDKVSFITDLSNAVTLAENESSESMKVVMLLQILTI